MAERNTLVLARSADETFASAQQQLKVLQWATQVLTGAAIVLWGGARRAAASAIGAPELYARRAQKALAGAQQKITKAG